MPTPTSPPPSQHVASIGAMVLTGGQGTRMGGADKGLQLFKGTPLVQHALQRLGEQTPAPTPIAINANRNLARYRTFGPVVWPDDPALIASGSVGPLAGFLTGLQHMDTPLLLTVPCDTPFFPRSLCQRLFGALLTSQADVAVAATPGPQWEPMFCLMRRSVRPALQAFVHNGQRKAAKWISSQRHVVVVFDHADDNRLAFANINTLAELDAMQRAHRAPPEHQQGDTLMPLPKDITIRLLTDTDLTGYKTLRDKGLRADPEAFTTDFDTAAALPPATYVTRIGQLPDDHFVLGAFDAQDVMVGAVVYERHSTLKKRHEATLAGMIITPSRQRQGIGRAMLDQFDQLVRQIPGLEQVVLRVTATNSHAVKLYEKAGFKSYGTQPRAIQVDGHYHDEVLMIKTL